MILAISTLIRAWSLFAFSPVMAGAQDPIQRDPGRFDCWGKDQGESCYERVMKGG